MLKSALTFLAVSAAIAASCAADAVGAPVVGSAPQAAAEAVQTAAQPAVPPAPQAAASAEAAKTADDPNQWVLGSGETKSGLPQGAEAPGYKDILRVGLSLAGVIAVIAAGVWAFKRFAPRTATMFASENLRVVSRTYLGPKQAIYIVKAPSSLLVVGATQESINLLAEVKDPIEIERVIGAAHAASPKSSTRSFKSLLSGVTGASSDNDAQAELAAAVRSVSDRFAHLNRRLEAFEEKAD